MSDRTAPLLALVGPTAAGKTAAALDVAEKLGAEIVSVDSMLVYRGLDIGTAKPTVDERARVVHHLIDVADPSEPFSVARYQVLGRDAISEIGGRRARAVLVGGSGLYFRSLVDDLEFPSTDAGVRSELEREAAIVGPGALYRRLALSDPAAAGRIERGNTRRIVRALEVAAVTGRDFSSFSHAWQDFSPGHVRAAGIAMPGDVLALRVARRVREMMDRGFLEEVRRLIEQGFGRWLTSTQAIGYAEMVRHLEGGLALEGAVAETVKRTKKLARRQMAWFRRDPRIRWFDAGEEGASALTEDILEYLA